MTEDDPVRVEDLFLAADFAVLGCDVTADLIRSAKTHDDVEMIKLQCEELLQQADSGKEVHDQLLKLVAFDAEAAQREEDAKREAAKRAGAAARALGAIAAEDIVLMDELQASGLTDWAVAIEMCDCQEDVEKMKRLMRYWAQSSPEIEELRACLPPERRHEVEKLRRLLRPETDPTW